SDIDLIFAFPEAGTTVDGPKSIGNEEFFVGLCRRFLKVFGTKGPEGILFRVDTRLRPFGESGPLAMSFNATVEYYQRQGREWERYALIKTVVLAGDRKNGAILMERLKPFVYRRYLDYGTYDALREMKQSIALEVERKGLADNIKLGSGGIREIEFFGQIFQLVRGGVEPSLQERGILKVLSTLAQSDYIPQRVCDELTEAYQFLRNTEHRLQEFLDQQTHKLPTDRMQRQRLAASMGFGDWKSFMGELEIHQRNVHFHFNDILVKEDDDASDVSIDDELNAIWQGLLEDREAEEVLFAMGYQNPGGIQRLLEFLRSDSTTLSLSPVGHERLDKLIPIVLKKAGNSENPETALTRIIDLVKAIQQRTVYLSLLLENPDALTHLVRLANASPWIVSFLSRHPLLLDELLDSRSLYAPPDKDELENELRLRLQRVPGDDLERQLEELTIFKNVNTLHIAAADVFGAFPLMRVSDFLSDTAETVLTEVLELAWSFLVEKYGKPVALLDGMPCERGFAIVGYGKLGGIELGYGSDLDLVFLHAGIDEPTEGGEAGGMDTPQFYNRLGQRIVHLLTTLTNVGRLYEIDMRLRPSGSSGILVSNVEAFADYQAEEAWTWEHQALVRARPICGDVRIVAGFDKIRKEILAKTRDKGTLREEIRSMRRKMKKEKESGTSNFFDIKQSSGGIVDIEFLVQYLVLLHANQYNDLTKWTDVVRLLKILAETGILAEAEANILNDAYLVYRSEVHSLNLQEKPALAPENKFHNLPNKVRKIWEYYFKD
ncbi:MAG: bifunctional [glutamate--ammonia ligase]-adenylyl-L-tyrosine phosphorylase/[glutamate--ammonia-ligase] adenylyltransferase, partial [Proteobacteria bacterium]|nr:bifunctional [glutamate--ammonia ligase]-adenylyl-L-tyrosine phosphorylase/[glutamate--ammonia-ligase] adenylyltransferase [Pseudomonadota bacterium]